MGRKQVCCTRKYKKFYIFIILWSIISVLPFTLYAKDRCQDYITDIRSYGIQYNGADFPWWYNLGCAMTESNCRGDLTSFDNGRGIFQFTDKVGPVAEIQKYIPVDVYNPSSSIRAQAYYIMIIRTKKFTQKEVRIYNKYKAHPSKFVEKCGLNLADVYRFYNGGYWFFIESEKGGFVCSNDEIKKFCTRGGTYTDKKKTKWLSFCDVNYSYPDKVFKYAKPYKTGKDGQRFYYEKPSIPPYLLRTDDYDIFFNKNKVFRMF